MAEIAILAVGLAVMAGGLLGLVVWMVVIDYQDKKRLAPNGFYTCRCGRRTHEWDNWMHRGH